jgi:hypothetical protein
MTTMGHKDGSHKKQIVTSLEDSNNAFVQHVDGIFAETVFG